MKINHSIFLLLIFPIATWAQNTYSIRINSISGNTFPITNTADATAEGPPLVKPGGMRSYYLTTEFSRLFPCSYNIATVTNSLPLPGYNSTVVSTPLTWWGGFRVADETGTWQWKRNYNGVVSQHSITVPSRGPVVIAFVHGENKNEKVRENHSGGSYTDWYYQNTILPEKKLVIGDEDTYSGMKSNGQYSDCFAAYFGFIGASFTDNTENNSWGNAYYNELGPVVWPSNGYVTPQRKQASNGVRHPFSIVDNGYIYIYYQDTRVSGDLDPDGRDQGLKLARVSVANSLNPNAYEVYYNGIWHPSLPSGFTVTNMMNFLTTPGPKSSVITGDGNTVHFAIAKVRNTGWFIAIEGGYGNNNSPKLVFRLSTDLIHWTEGLYTVADATSGSFEYGGAQFLDNTGTTNSEIDLHDFFVIGMASSSSPRNTVNRMHLNIDILENIQCSWCPPDQRVINTTGITSPTEETALENVQTILKEKMLSIYSQEEDGNKKYSLYTLYGQLIKEFTSDGSKQFDMNLGDISASGIYMLRVDSKNNHYVKKIFVD